LTALAATLAPHATFTSLPDAAWGMNYVDPARLAQSRRHLSGQSRSCRRNVIPFIGVPLITEWAAASSDLIGGALGPEIKAPCARDIDARPIANPAGISRVRNNPNPDRERSRKTGSVRYWQSRSRAPCARPAQPPHRVSDPRSRRDNPDPVIAQILAASARPAGAVPIHRSPGDPPIGVLIVAAQPIVRLGLVTLFTTRRGCRVVDNVKTIDEAVDALHTSRPDVIIVDTDLSTEAPSDAYRMLEAWGGRARVILLASVAEPHLVVAALSSGIGGYVLKHTDPARLVEAVEAVASGGTYFDPSALSSALEWVRRGREGGDRLQRLTGQERHVLALVAEGKTNKAIAVQLKVSEHTVKTYVSSLLKKLGLSRRTEAAAFLTRRHGGATDPPSGSSYGASSTGRDG
jgi:two-component system, NarL family, response regulator DevR